MYHIVSPLIICVLCFAGIRAAAESNYGIVRDNETLTPLAGVQVTAVGSGDTQITDSTGRFLFEGAGIRRNRVFLTYNNTVRWNACTNTLDISNAPDLIALRLFSLDGKLHMNFQSSSGYTSVALPSLGPGAYVMKATTMRGDVFLRTVPIADDRTFSIVFPAIRIQRTAKRAVNCDTLIFSKEFYRVKKFGYRIDSTYSGCTVDLAHSIGDYIFLDTVRTYRLTISETDMNTLLDYTAISSGPGVTNPVYVPAHLSFENRELDSVAVRFRGDQSLWDCITNGVRNVGVRYPQFGYGDDDVCAKFSFKFSFKKYKDDQRLYGLKKLNLRSMSYDPSKMREHLGFSFFHDMGIVAPRTAYARLYVNNDFWGLFCVAEEIDGRMTKSRFPESGDGNLYEDLWPDSVTTDAMILEALRTNEEGGNIDDFKTFHDVVLSESTTDANFINAVGEYVDIPYLIRYMAVDRAVMNFDGLVSVYVGTGYRVRHNYFWYRDLPTSKFILIPWDLDKVFFYPEPNFWTNNRPVDNNTVPNWNVVNGDYTPIGCYFDPSTIAMNFLAPGPYYNVQPIDADKFLRSFRNATWNDFVATGRRFLDEIFLQDTIDARLSRWRRQIATSVGEDETIDSTAWEIMVDSLSHTIPLIRTHFELMLDTLIVASNTE